MFKKPKRAPRKIGRDSPSPPASKPHYPDSDNGKPPNSLSSILLLTHPAYRSLIQPDIEPSVVVKRPTKSKSTKPKPSLPVRRPTTLADDDSDDGGGVSLPNHTEENDPFAQVERKRASQLPLRSQDEQAPRYTTSYLESLKAEQSHAPPLDAQIVLEDDLPPSPASSTNDNDHHELPEAPSYIPLSSHPLPASTALLSTSTTPGTLTTNYQTHIPTATEIAEKKARRARLAQEEKAEDFIPLEDHSPPSSNESENDNLIVRASEARPRNKYGKAEGESRIGGYQLEDDDFAEGFDEFVEGTGKVETRNLEAHKERERRREDITKRLAEEANEEDEEDDVDEEEAERLKAYEDAQTRAGTYSERRTGGEHRAQQEAREREQRWKEKMEMQYIVRPVPSVREVLKGLRERKEAMVQEREGVEKRVEAVKRERREVVEEEVRVQGLLKEAGERLERVQMQVAEKAREEEMVRRGVEEKNQSDGGKTMKEDDASGFDATGSSGRREDGSEIDTD